MGDHRALAGLDQIDVDAVDGHRLGARWHRDDPVIAAAAMPVRTLAVAAAFGAEMFAPPQRPEVTPRRIADQHDVSPVPAVATVGTAPRHVRFTPEADAAVAAAAGLDPDFCGVVHPIKVDGGRPAFAAATFPDTS